MNARAGEGGRAKGGVPTARTPKAKVPKTPKASKAAPPTVEAVAARLLSFFPAAELPALWKEAELKRRLTAAERPLVGEAMVRLQAERQVLALTQGKGVFYLFAGPLRGWLDGAPVVVEPVPSAAAGAVAEQVDLFALYARLVRESGGFPDVKIGTLRAALDLASSEALAGRLAGLWREGRATLSQGDWSLADEATRAAAVELNGERYLLVRLE